MVEMRCDKRCCSVKFCPLQLSFGMTLHTFQGQSAGPVDKGQPKNAVDRVIVEPGTKGFEGNNPGTLYMATSRATTTGTGCNDSALYFTGPNLSRYRITDLRFKKGVSNGSRQMYKKVHLREKWVNKLELNTRTINLSTSQVKDMLEWCDQTIVDTQTLDDALTKRDWRASMNKSINY